MDLPKGKARKKLVKVEPKVKDEVLISKADLNLLVTQIVTYCEKQAGITLFPYQREFAERIVESVVLNDGEEITALFSRQSGKTEAVAILIAGMLVIIPKLAELPQFQQFLGHFKSGFWVGIFAPSKEQSFTTFSRTRDRLRSGNAKIILNDPEIDTSLDKESNPMLLSNGSIVMMHSAAKQSQIESKTYHLLIIEEAQDVDRLKVLKCLAGETRIATRTGYHALENVVKNKIKDVAFYRGMTELAFATPLEYHDNGVQDVYEITLKCGANIQATDNHQFYTRTCERKGKPRWATVREIIGLGGSVQIAVAKKPHIKIEPTDRTPIFRFRGVSTIRYVGKKNTYCLTMPDRNFIANDFISSNSIHPMGASTNATLIKIGTSNNRRCEFWETIQRNKRRDNKKNIRRNHYEFDYNIAQKYNPRYRKYIVNERRRLGEDSDEFRMSYKLEWLLERGMFCSVEQIAAMQDKTVKHELTSQGYCVAGIDLGKKKDSTVVTILECDIESAVRDDVTDDLKPPKKILNWLEISGDNYESQYHEVLDFLKKYNIRCVYVDSTGVGTPIADRLVVELDGIAEVTPYDFSRPSKSVMWKTLSAEIAAGRIIVPAHAKTRELRAFRNFILQMEQLEKDWQGQYLVANHAKDDKNAHDDYCDSLGLAVLAAHSNVMPVIETSTNDFFSRRK